ncbi:MAG: hypothetical protein ACK5RL_08455 [Acidimicrobiales bacterium]
MNQPNPLDAGSNDDPEFDRQRQIWEGLYGPSRANDMIAEAVKHRSDNPLAELKDLFKRIESRHDDGNEDDVDEAGTMRPI